MSDDGGEGGSDGRKKGQKKAKKSNKSKANQRKNSKKSNTPQTGNDLSAKIFATMEKHKEVFFVIRLHSAQSAASLAVSISKVLFLWGFRIFFKLFKMSKRIKCYSFMDCFKCYVLITGHSRPGPDD